jgi:hypothetical protein
MNTDRAAGGSRRIAPIPHRKIAMQVVHPSERIMPFRVDSSERRGARELRSCLAAETYMRGSVTGCY